MDDAGQAYIATAVALGALLVAMFAMPAITHASLEGGTQADSTARRAFFHEVDDVVRVLNQTAHADPPVAEVYCTSEVDYREIPGDESNFTEHTIWTCETTDDCGGESLVSAVHDALDEIRPLIRAAINGSAELQPDCTATCDDDEEDVYPSPEPASTAIDVSLQLASTVASAAFYEETFGGRYDVDVQCIDATPPP